VNIVRDFTESPEPFSSVVELLGEYGAPNVLASVYQWAELQSKHNECSSCRLKNANLSLRLGRLIEAMIQLEENIQECD
jgi:uncharacterized protein (UPF0179 family)